MSVPKQPALFFPHTELKMKYSRKTPRQESNCHEVWGEFKNNEITNEMKPGDLSTDEADSKLTADSDVFSEQTRSS